jgi:hypothetical protein
MPSLKMKKGAIPQCCRQTVAIRPGDSLDIRCFAAGAIERRSHLGRCGHFDQSVNPWSSMTWNRDLHAQKGSRRRMMSPKAKILA